MKRLDKFVNSIYEDVSDKGTKELKQEMRTHLLEAVAELKSEGKTEKEAIDIAIHRFGDNKQISKGLIGLFKAQNKIVKNLSGIAFVTFVIGLIFIGLFSFSKQNVQETNNFVGEIAISYDDKTELTIEDISEIQSLTTDEQFDNVIYFAMFKHPNEKVFEPAETSRLQSEMGFGRIGSGESGTFVYESENWIVEWEFKDYGFERYKFISYLLFITSGLSFVAWIFVYSRSRLGS